MIFPTTFILTLFLIQVGRVVAQSVVYGKAYYSDSYDNKIQPLDQVPVACSNLPYPTLGDVPSFPFIGGAPNTPFNSLNCGKCWKITNQETGESKYFTAIDNSGTKDHFVLSNVTFTRLGGTIMTGSFDARAEMVDDKDKYLCANQHTD